MAKRRNFTDQFKAKVVLKLVRAVLDCTSEGIATK